MSCKRDVVPADDPYRVLFGFSRCAPNSPPPRSVRVRVRAVGIVGFAPHTHVRWSAGYYNARAGICLLSRRAGVFLAHGFSTCGFDCDIIFDTIFALARPARVNLFDAVHACIIIRARRRRHRRRRRDRRCRARRLAKSIYTQLLRNPRTVFGTLLKIPV